MREISQLFFWIHLYVYDKFLLSEMNEVTELYNRLKKSLKFIIVSFLYFYHEEINKKQNEKKI